MVPATKGRPKDLTEHFDICRAAVEVQKKPERCQLVYQTYWTSWAPRPIANDIVSVEGLHEAVECAAWSSQHCDKVPICACPIQLLPCRSRSPRKRLRDQPAEVHVPDDGALYSHLPAMLGGAEEIINIVTPLQTLRLKGRLPIVVRRLCNLVPESYISHMNGTRRARRTQRESKQVGDSTESFKAEQNQKDEDRKETMKSIILNQ
ncbi:hypothetical protein PsorP6_014576 [Peronosclerospora sorghi]|uniref:Uncharacterized protein n=1 Tax=Peronosclerospora sorghi TaxID=230839 RepID=A0ACC0VTP7_9STRA|nr:hypothetical protein PsorP6_014576 [Peronosclerospora sorghi]